MEKGGDNVIKRRYIVLASCVASILLGGFLFNEAILAQTGGSYDPWVDYNEDGIVDAHDLYPLSEAYSSSGNPTKNVSMKYGTLSWSTVLYLPPSVGGSIYNSTQGYEQITLVIIANTSVDIDLEQSMPIPSYEYIEELDGFTVTPWEWYTRTYDISEYPYLRSTIDNPSETDVAEVHLYMYMTASEDTTQTVDVTNWPVTTDVNVTNWQVSSDVNVLNWPTETRLFTETITLKPALLNFGAGARKRCLIEDTESYLPGSMPYEWSVRTIGTTMETLYNQTFVCEIVPTKSYTILGAPTLSQPFNFTQSTGGASSHYIITQADLGKISWSGEWQTLRPLGSYTIINTGSYTDSLVHVQHAHLLATPMNTTINAYERLAIRFTVFAYTTSGTASLSYEFLCNENEHGIIRIPIVEDP